MRISDWSSDVCSSDLVLQRGDDRMMAIEPAFAGGVGPAGLRRPVVGGAVPASAAAEFLALNHTRPYYYARKRYARRASLRCRRKGAGRRRLCCLLKLHSKSK